MISTNDFFNMGNIPLPASPVMAMGRSVNPMSVPSAFPPPPLPVTQLQPPTSGPMSLPPVPSQVPQPDMSQVSTDQLSPFGHIGDVINQYVVNKQQQQDNNGFVSNILSQRFQPSFADTNEAGLREAQSYASKGGFQAYSPQDIANEHLTQQLTPYSSMLGLQGQQADVMLKTAQANQANAMSQFFTGFGGGQGGAAPTGQPVNGANGTQMTFNPRGAMMAKMLGLPEGMQISASGQPEQIPGVVTPGQKEQDTQFAQAWQTYANAGGAARTQNAISVVDDVINQLKSGQIKTGADDLGSRLAWNVDKNEPSQYGVLMNPTLLSARNRVSSAILPQAKALFGSRVTNFDAQAIVNSKGLDPISDTATNIQKLEQLKMELMSGQKDLMTSGQYFQQHGTLAGYQPAILQQQPAGQDQMAAPSTGAATHRYNPATGQVEAIQ